MIQISALEVPPILLIVLVDIPVGFGSFMDTSKARVDEHNASCVGMVVRTRQHCEIGALFDRDPIHSTPRIQRYNLD